MIRRLTFLLLAAVLALGIFIASSHWQVNAATGQSAQSSEGPSTPDRASGTAQRYGRRASERRPPGPAIDPYVRPEFAAEMRTLRPAILAAAQRHNRPQLSGMSDHDFAVVIALLMYNEHFGWFEERVRPVQALTPFYEDLQRQTNEAGFANLSVWPANIRPSVALEILRQQVPLPSNTGTLTAPIVVDGSRVRPDRYSSLGALYAAITAEITDPEMAVEYLAANLERGIYRAHIEGLPVTWRALAAWHNQGIVAPEEIRDNPTASDYVHRASAYFGKARALIDWQPPRIPDSKYLIDDR